MKNTKYKKIENAYRLNSSPFADVARAISINQNIPESLKSNKNHKSCNIQVLSDSYVNIKTILNRS